MRTMITVMTIVAATTSMAQEKNALDPLQQEYEKQHQSVLMRYGDTLDTAIVDLKKKGDLDGVLVLQDEKKRFHVEKTVPTPRDAKDSFRPATVAFYQAEITLLRKYVESLDRLIKKNVAADRIEAAKVIKSEKHKAEFMLADTQTKLPMETAVGRSEADILGGPAGPASTEKANRFVVPLALQRHLLVYFPFEESAEGRTSDLSPNGNHAIIVGAKPDAAGKLGACLDFDGDHDFVEAAVPIGAGKGTTPRTICVWFKIRKYDRWAAIGGFGNASNGENFQIEACAGGRFWVLGWGKHRDWDTGIENTPYRDANWHHIAVTYDSKTTTVYLDGQRKASTSEFAWDTVPSRIVIGEEIDKDGRSFDGLIDEFMMFSKALSQSEIRDVLRSADSMKPSSK